MMAFDFPKRVELLSFPFISSFKWLYFPEKLVNSDAEFDSILDIPSYLNSVHFWLENLGCGFLAHSSSHLPSHPHHLWVVLIIEKSFTMNIILPRLGS
jgi:hypothetical protein